MTKDVINKLPANVGTMIENFKQQYKETNDFDIRKEVRTRMAGYVLGLRDAGLLTESERKTIFIYMTI